MRAHHIGIDADDGGHGASAPLPPYVFSTIRIILAIASPIH
jgi:hypothetical protein